MGSPAPSEAGGMGVNSGNNNSTGRSPFMGGKSLALHSSAFHLPPSRGVNDYSGSNNSSVIDTPADTSPSTASNKRQYVTPGSSNKVTSPRHHPYMSPTNKGYTPSIMSNLQSYRPLDYPSSKNEDEERNRDLTEPNNVDVSNDNNLMNTNNRHPW